MNHTFKGTLIANYQVEHPTRKDDNYIPFDATNRLTEKFIEHLERSDNIIEVVSIKLVSSKREDKKPQNAFFTFDVKFVGKENRTVGDFINEFGKVYENEVVELAKIK